MRPAEPPHASSRPAAPRTRGPRLGPREARIAAALAAAAMPPGAFLEGGGERTVVKLHAWLEGASALHVNAIRALLWAAELAAIASTGRRFTALPVARATRFLEAWQGSRIGLRRSLLRAILTPLKAAHFDDPAMLAHVGCDRAPGAPRADETARWMQQVTNGRDARAPLDLECEVVVVGTGAGGAACAYELASRGRAVVLLEEGDYHARSAFGSRASLAFKKLYRDQGLTFALGNVAVPVWAGRAVGGSTVVNSGTCYRAPERTFRAWRDMGLTGFSSESMAPYYARVEQMLRVEAAGAHLTGGVGRVVARGAGALGLRHGPLMRNAPDCDGQGVCCFGCPTGAKRSTDVSYVPEALKNAAVLVTAARVDDVEVSGGRARGVRGALGSGERFHVRAQAVVIAGGALMTPVLLKSAGILRGSAMLGRNLSIHPASKVLAVFDETIDMASAIPQGYAVDHFADEGIVFEGASTPLDVTAVGLPWVGAKLMDVMEAYRRVATFGFMIQDTSRGTVRPGLGGSPLITYDLNAPDTALMARAIALLCDIFLAAGARRVLPLVAGLEEVRTAADVARLRAMRIAPGDFEVTAFHPLGTCRIGCDPRTSVLGPDHQAHELPGLYVTDGSAVPTSLGVNPQMTIMAMALRAAEILDARL